MKRDNTILLATQINERYLPKIQKRGKEAKKRVKRQKILELRCRHF